jgi:hypothetical protein
MARVDPADPVCSTLVDQLNGRAFSMKLLSVCTLTWS